MIEEGGSGHHRRRREGCSTRSTWLESDVCPTSWSSSTPTSTRRRWSSRCASSGCSARPSPRSTAGSGSRRRTYARIVERDLRGVDVAHRRAEHPSDGGASSSAASAPTSSERVPSPPRRAASCAAVSRSPSPTAAPTCRRSAPRRARGRGVYVRQRHQDVDHQRARGNCLAVLVKTDTGAEPRHPGMSLFLVPRRSRGYTVAASSASSGTRASTPSRSSSTTCVVPGDRLLGGVEGRGFQQARGGLELGRINVAARGVGVADAALEASLALRAAAPARWASRSASTRRSS